jgi:hypothetical protein
MHAAERKSWRRYQIFAVYSFHTNQFMSDIVQVSQTPASQNHPRAPTTGVREAPRHEIAGRKGLCFAAAIYGDLRSASVCFREAGTTDARQVDGLTGRGERAPPALGSVSAWRRRLQDVGAASSSERRRRWLTVSGKNGKNGRRCVAVDNAISIMTYRS